RPELLAADRRRGPHLSVPLADRGRRHRRPGKSRPHRRRRPGRPAEAPRPRAGADRHLGVLDPPAGLSHLPGGGPEPADARAVAALSPSWSRGWPSRPARARSPAPPTAPRTTAARPSPPAPRDRRRRRPAVRRRPRRRRSPVCGARFAVAGRIILLPLAIPV